MVTTVYKAGKRPRIRVFDAEGKRTPLPNLVLTKINGKTAYFRSSHVVGEMAVSITGPNHGRIEIIAHPDGTPVLEGERWPTLNPYDTGARLEPKPWVKDGVTGNEYRRPSEPDDYGRVDFDDDSGATVATAYAERVDGTYVLVIYSHETDSETRINLHADLSIYDVSTRSSQGGTEGRE